MDGETDGIAYEHECGHFIGELIHLRVHMSTIAPVRAAFRSPKVGGM